MTENITREFDYKQYEGGAFGLLRLHQVFTKVIGETYACAVTVDRIPKTNPYSISKGPLAPLGLEMKELFVNGNREVKVTSFGNSHQLFNVKHPFEKIEYERIYNLIVSYQNLDLKEIKHIENLIKNSF